MLIPTSAMVYTSPPWKCSFAWGKYINHSSNLVGKASGSLRAGSIKANVPYSDKLCGKIANLLSASCILLKILRVRLVKECVVRPRRQRVGWVSADLVQQ